MKRKLAGNLRKVAIYLEKFAAKKKKPGRSYQGWIKHLKKMDAPTKTIDAFKGRWKGALEHAEDNKDKKRFKTKDLREQYAARVAIDKLPKKYLKEPTKHHGPGKSGPIPGKKKKSAAEVYIDVAYKADPTTRKSLNDYLGRYMVTESEGLMTLKVPEIKKEALATRLEKMQQEGKISKFEIRS